MSDSSGSRDRVRRCRERQARGAVVVSAELQSDLLQGLQDFGFIERRQTADRKALGRAVAEALRSYFEDARRA